MHMFHVQQKGMYEEEIHNKYWHYSTSKSSALSNLSVVHACTQKSDPETDSVLLTKVTIKFALMLI